MSLGSVGTSSVFEQPHQVRVVPFVVDDEARIDGDLPAAVVDVDGVGVPSQPVIGLEDGDVGARERGTMRLPALRSRSRRRRYPTCARPPPCDRFSLKNVEHVCIGSVLRTYASRQDSPPRDRSGRKWRHAPAVPCRLRSSCDDLLPVVERSLERHLSAAKEWFPHEFVPYEEGRNFVKEPWRPDDSDVPDVAQTALEVNLLTEDNLPYYHLSIWRAFGDEDAWGEWVRRWTAEEGRHAIALRDFLTVTRGLDPALLERGRMDMVSRGWYPRFAQEGPLDGLMFTAIQELATRISHRNTGEITGDELIEKLCSRIAIDENLHHVFYRDMARRRSRWTRRRRAGATPAGHRFRHARIGDAGVPEKAKAMARVGVYNLRIHHDQVLRPSAHALDVGRHHRSLRRGGAARDDIIAHLARLERVAGKLGSRHVRPV